jgi:glutaminyl-tRNA synthetase
MENPPKKFYRLSPGKEVRDYYFITCVEVVKDPASGEVTGALHLTPDPRRTPRRPQSQERCWVSAAHAVTAEVRLYDQLFTTENPNDVADGALHRRHQPRSLTVLNDCRIEPGPPPHPAAATSSTPGLLLCRSQGVTAGRPVFNTLSPCATPGRK